MSVACFRRKTKTERQVFHLTLFLSFCAYNTPVSWTAVRRVFGLVLLAASLAALVWGLWPLPVQTRSLAISPAEMRPEELPASQALDNLPAISEPRLLHLEWPPLMRSGDPASIRLAFAPAQQPGASPPASSGAGGDYSVLAEARLELPGIPHTPLGQVSQAFLPGRPLTFVWDILPDRAGETDGTVWLHLRFIPAVAGPDLRRVLTAQRIQVRVSEFFGLSGPWARALGSAGVVVGVVLGLDGAASWLWQRRVRKSGG